MFIIYGFLNCVLFLSICLSVCLWGDTGSCFQHSDNKEVININVSVL